MPQQTGTKVPPDKLQVRIKPFQNTSDDPRAREASRESDEQDNNNEQLRLI